jgi:hypothetical protein
MMPGLEVQGILAAAMEETGLVRLVKKPAGFG